MPPRIALQDERASWGAGFSSSSLAQPLSQVSPACAEPRRRHARQGHATPGPQDGVALRCQGLAACRRAGTLVAAVFPLLLGLPRGSTVVDEPITLASGTDMPRPPPSPALVSLPREGSITECEEMDITTWLKLSLIETLRKSPSLLVSVPLLWYSCGRKEDAL